MKDSPKYAYYQQRVSPPRQPEVSMFNTNISFDQQSDSSMVSTYKNNILHHIRQDPVIIEDGKLMMRYIMVCAEIDRLNRKAEKTKLAYYNELQQLKEFKSEFEILKLKDQNRSKDLTALNEQIASLRIKLKHFEQTLRQKQRLLALKEQEIRSTRLELTGMSLSHSRMEQNQKNRLREIEAEYQMERGRTSDITRRKEELERQLRQVKEREINLERTMAANQGKMRSLEEELKNLRNIRSKSESDQQQYMSLQREKDNLTRKIQQLQNKLSKNDQTASKLRQAEIEASSSKEQLIQAHSKIKKLESDLTASQNQARGARNQQNDSLRKQLANLEAKLTLLNSTSEKSSQNKEIVQLTKERDNLSLKIEQLLSDISRMQKTLSTREACKNCARLTDENSMLSRKMGVLEQSLRERETELQRRSMHSTTVTSSSGKDSRMSVKDLLLSAQQLKGSNERMCRLLQSGEQYELKSVTKSVSQRVLIGRH